MYTYQYPTLLPDGESNSQDVASAFGNAPQVFWVPVLVPYWGSPQSLYDYRGEQTGGEWKPPGGEQMAPVTDFALPPASCHDSEDSWQASCHGTAGDTSDAFSDASTDVGEDDDLADLREEDMGLQPDEDSSPVNAIEAPATPCFFAKLDRQQRVEQLKRVTDEFCALDFDSVDASSQEALVRRMLTTLKSLSESTSFYAEEGRLQMKRMLLLDLGEGDEDAIKEVTGRAEHLCEARSFRAAFAVLQEVAPQLRGNPLPVSKLPMSAEEIEAMKQRRLEKRQRQRQERRVQRVAVRTDRPPSRFKGAPTSSSSCTATIPSNRCKGASASSSSSTTAWTAGKEIGAKRRGG